MSAKTVFKKEIDKIFIYNSYYGSDSTFIINLIKKRMECFGCINNLKGDSLSRPQDQVGSGAKIQNKVEDGEDKVEAKQKVADQQEQNPIRFLCQCCDNYFCLTCCKAHMLSWMVDAQNKMVFSAEKSEDSLKQKIRIEANNPEKTIKYIKIVCQECEDAAALKYCQNCGQHLCEKCSFKIHNKGKRAKHTLEEKISRNVVVTRVVLFSRELIKFLKANEIKGKIEDLFDEYTRQKFISCQINTLFLMEECCLKQFNEKIVEQYLISTYQSQTFKFQDLLAFKNKYPFINQYQLVIFSKEVTFHNALSQEYQNSKKKGITLDICQQWKKTQPIPKHERVLSQKIAIKHNKNISNFSGVSAISRAQNHSVISNQPSDLFQVNELSMNVTLNQNSSILMMGQQERQDKEEKKQQNKQQKENEKIPNAHRIYSIREENSHTSANNLSTSTENSIRKRNRKWPIPYFQPFRISKYQRGPKYDAELYLRDLAEKGILMIRREKAQQYLLQPQVTRSFVRNIGQREIEYVAYIIDFLSVECLAWVIESVKQDKMTPNQKLIQSRLKESFDLKVNAKLWQSIIKYLQSVQYESDYLQNTKIRYVPKITVVKYQDQFLLEFEQRKWAYEDQDLLDQQEEEWKQFKQLITDYFNGRNQITGGRYGCVQYVKLNGPKPLRKCSLGKISMFVQEAINKGIIRYHKTLLVSNSQHNNSVCGREGLDEGAKWTQLQRDLKIMAIQLALVDMFMESPPLTPISLAQIPLNLKKSIIFDYTLVQLGFPKLKNILNTLSDKLILQTTKTHITYQITTNGSEAIERMRRQAMDLNQRFLSHVVTQVGAIILHFQTLTLDDLYSQLSARLGFSFEYKLYQIPDFYQFVLYYCSNVAAVQFASGVFLVTAKYQSYPVYEHQTHRSSYSQDIYPTYQDYQYYPTDAYSKTSQKKYHEPLKSQQIWLHSLETPQMEAKAVATPTFNSSLKNSISYPQQRKGSFGWGDFLEQERKDEKQEEEVDENHSRNMEHIINILDVHLPLIKECDMSAHRPKTVIVNEGAEHQFYLLPKLDHPGDEIDSLVGEVTGWVQGERMQKEVKGQHTRFKSTNQVTTKHSRQLSSTANTRK